MVFVFDFVLMGCCLGLMKNLKPTQHLGMFSNHFSPRLRVENGSGLLATYPFKSRMRHIINT